MHPLRSILFISFILALAVVWGISAALQAAGVEQARTFLVAVGAFLALVLPWVGVSIWALRGASDLERLTDFARRSLSPASAPVPVRVHHAELDDLARAIEDLRERILRQEIAHDEHRAAMDEIVSSLGEGLLAVNPRGTIVVANAKVAEIFGVSGSVVGRGVLETVRKQAVVAAIDRALEGRASIDRVSLGSGDAERQIEIRAVPVESSSEIAAAALFIDVTTVQRLQRVRRDFLDDFSHEVRTPLAGLRSAAETLDSEGLTEEHERQLRAVMQRQISRIERLVTDLAELNQIETGQLVLQRQPVELRELLEELCADFGEVADRVRFRVEGEALTLSADASRMQQVFSNLLDNAIRHGGADGDVSVGLSREGDQAIITVSDNGPGIPPHELDRIFHRFYRVDRSRTQPGSGLGLSIAKHLVALHGGTIRAYNRSRGATFEVRLPGASRA